MEFVIWSYLQFPFSMVELCDVTKGTKSSALNGNVQTILLWLLWWAGSLWLLSCRLSNVFVENSHCRTTQLSTSIGSYWVLIHVDVVGRPVRAIITLYPIGRHVRAIITLYPIGRHVRVILHCIL